MNLLVITRKVDVTDDRVGFFRDWLNQFSSKLDKLYIICLEQGDTTGLAGNIKVFSMGQERGYSRLRKYLIYRKLLKQILPKVNGVFVHMIPRFVNLAGQLVKRHHKPMILWYTHKSVDRALRRTQRYVSAYVTASPESFRLTTKVPVHVLGHGIPVEKFSAAANNEPSKRSRFIILTVGRLAPVKNLTTLVAAVNLLIHNKQQTTNPVAVSGQSLVVSCQIIGAPALVADRKYVAKLRHMVENLEISGHIDFLGPKSHDELIDFYQQADIFVNLSATGSLDKTVLEAMACELPVLTSNEAFKPILGELVDRLMFQPNSAQSLADKILSFKKMSQTQRAELGGQLRQIVVGNHSLDTNIEKIIKLF